MAVKKSNPIGTFFTIVLVLALAAVLYYGLVMAVSAGPAAEEAAEKAKLGIGTDTIADISYIPYEALSEPYRLTITKEEYEAVMKQTAPDEKTIELFEKINIVQNEPQLLQGACTYYCGSPENPVVGEMKIKGIKYKVSHVIQFAPNIKNFDPEVVKWTVTVERLTFAN